MDDLQCLTCVEKHKIKMLIKQGNQKDLQIAILKDQLEFASEQSDTFAKSLKNIYDKLENLYDSFSEDEDFSPSGDVEAETNYMLREIRLLKNSIPESALRRAE